MKYIREHWNYLTESGVYPGVDLLRAAAVTLVLLYHFQLLFIGWVGVDLFFVISGFLIGGIILDKAMAGRFSFADFYGRRALRILPVYYFVILLCVIFKAHTPLDLTAIKTIISGMLFLQTTGQYFFPEFFSLNDAYTVGGSWSLVIEEMFYLVAPVALLLFVAICRRNLSLVAFLVGAVVLSGILVRAYMTSNFAPEDPNWHFASFIQFHSRYDELAAGVLAAALVRVCKDMRKHSEWWMTAAIILVAMFLLYIYNKQAFLTKPWTIARDTIWLPTLLAGAGMSLLLSSYWWKFHVIPVVVLARLSYPLYLVHILFLELSNPHGNEGLMLWMLNSFTFQGRAVVLMVVCILLAYLTSLFVEYPFIRIYKKNVGALKIEDRMKLGTLNTHPRRVS
ncbi:TPA: acyltransferase family protein [Aeromonas veronii]